MRSCDHCRKDADIYYECNYCGGIYCPNHRLPEGHGCDGVEFLSWNQEWVKRKRVTRNLRSIDDEEDARAKEYQSPQSSEPEGNQEAPGGETASSTSHRPFRSKVTDEIIASKSDFDSPEPITPELTVGTTPEPDFESSPRVRVKSDPEEARSKIRSVLIRLRNWGSKLIRKLPGLRHP